MQQGEGEEERGREEEEEEGRDEFSCGTGGPLGLEVRAEGRLHTGVLVHACSCILLLCVAS